MILNKSIFYPNFVILQKRNRMTMNKQILRLAIPNIISNITVPLLGMIDQAIVGHLSSELFIGAIAIASMIFNLIYWSFSFLRMGTSGFTAQAYGANDHKEMVNVLMKSLFVALLASVAIIGLQYFIFQSARYFIHDSANILDLAAHYFYIYVWAAPAVLGMYAFTGWFIGMQDAKTPMFVSIAVNAVNVAASLFFVFVFKWDLKGVALGSVIAQYTGLLLCLSVWLIKYRNLKQYIQFHFVRNLKELVPFFQVNSNIFLRSLCLIVVSTFFTSASAEFGNLTLSVNSLMMQLFILFSYMMDGFAYAAEAITGKYVGKKDPIALRLLIRKLFMWGIGLTALFTVAYAFFSHDILRLLTDKTAVTDLANQYIHWALLIPVAGFAAFLWDGIFIGMTASKEMRNSMFIAMISFFAIYYATISSLGNNGLWLAFIVYLAMRGLVQAFMFPRIKGRVGL